ncbi:MAG TPA: hypothetical protein VHC50_02615, partial [Puia sp.]|nr:hypothetical protein [Puia sp.]
MRARIIKWLLFVTAAGMLFSCSETKHLPEGQYLYDGAKIRIHSKPRAKKSERKELHAELEDLVRPKPNGTFLGIKVKLLLYNLAGIPSGKGLRYWIREHLGEPPVIASYS